MQRCPSRMLNGSNATDVRETEEDDDENGEVQKKKE